MDDLSFTTDTLEKELARLLSWIQSVETKISFVFPIATSMLGLLAGFAPPLACWTTNSVLLAITATCALSLSILFAALASFPRTSGPVSSLIFFGRIAAMPLEEYREAAKSLDENAYVEDLVKQCHRNAQIATQKYAWVKRALACLFAASLPWALSVYVLYSAQGQP